MTNWLPYFRRRQLVVFAAAALVLVYALGLLLYVQLTPNIGIRCAFRTVIIAVNYAQVSVEPGQPWPEPNDTVVQIGDRSIPTWIHFLRALREEHPPSDSVLKRATQAENETEVLIRVRFAKPNDPGTQYTCWCRFDTPHWRELVPSAIWLVLKFSLFLVGAFVFWKRPEDRSAILFFLFCILAVGAYMGGYHWARIVAQPALVLVFMVSAVLLPVVNLHFMLVFPRPKAFLEQRRNWTLAAVYGPPLAFLVAMLGSYFHVRALYELKADAEVIREALWDFRHVIYVYLGVAAFWYLISVASLVHSFLTARDATERNQVKWILAGFAVGVAPIGYTLYLAVWWPHHFGSGGATWPMFAASAFVTASFAVSITRYRLMQLEQILTSGVLYFAISTAAALAYYAVVLVTMVLVGSQVMDEPSLWLALGAGITVLVLLVILDLARSRLRKVLDRRFTREKYQLDRTLRRMGQAIEQLVDPPTLARRLLQASADLLGVSRGAVYLREGHSSIFQLVGWQGTEPPLNELSPGCPLVEALAKRGALVGTLRPEPGDVPAQRQLRLLGGGLARGLAHEGQLLALLVLGAKDAGPFTTEDLNLLSEFAQLTALALESAGRHQTIEALNGELRDKVEKIAEQQRRILTLQSQLVQRAEVKDQKAEVNGTGPEQPADPVPPPANLRPPGVVGSSPVMRQMFHLVRKVSASESAVLLRGESGTGKEVLARALHEQSPRAGKAFVKVHCAALSPGLLESELFGHVKGAFTGAHRDKVGRFELADGGTLFLDEIGDISLDMQTKLLRVLQEMTFERVGSGEPVAVDVRVLAATHQDLEQLIRDGKFREDLYYRLNVISIVVPPLRDRREDLAELAAHFLKLYAQKGGKAVTGIDDDAMVALKAHAWPGNIRELENVIERAVVVADGPTVTVQDLPAELARTAEGLLDTVHDLSVFPEEEPFPRGYVARADRDRRERERLVRALAAAQGNKAEAARALGLARSTLISRLKRHGLS